MKILLSIIMMKYRETLEHGDHLQAQHKKIKDKYDII